MDEAVETVNKLAPEHLKLSENAMEQVGKIRHAGAIFIGRYSSEPVGDYFAGQIMCCRRTELRVFQVR